MSLLNWLKPPPPLEEDPRAKLGLLPCSDTRPGDTFIIGFPKSGHTWVQTMLAAVKYGMDPRRCPDSVVADLIPDIHYRSHYRRYTEPMLLKAHSLPEPRFRRVIYLIRDGRDAMVSYHHNLQAVRGKDAIGFLEMVRDGTGLAFGPWEEHVTRWRENPHQAEVLTVKYEDLLADTEAELSKMAAFAGLEADNNAIQTAVEATRFENMQQRERRFGMDNPRWPKDRLFARRGQAGSHRDEMPEDVLEAFMKRAGETLKRCGYTA